MGFYIVTKATFLLSPNIQAFAVYGEYFGLRDYILKYLKKYEMKRKDLFANPYILQKKQITES